MSDFTISKHEIARFVNKIIEERKDCNCSLVFNISENDLIEINSLLYYAVEKIFLNEDCSKESGLIREKIKNIAKCCIENDKKNYS